MKKHLLLSLISISLLSLSLTSCNQSQLEDYTLNFQLTKDGELTSLPSYEVIYLTGDFNSSSYLPLELNSDGLYSYTFDSIRSGKYNYQIIASYKYETVGTDNSLPLANGSFKVSTGDNGSKTLNVEIKENLVDYSLLEEVFSAIEKEPNYKVCYEYSLKISREGITYKEFLEDNNNLVSEDILNSEYTLSEWKMEAYYTEDALLIADYYNLGYGLFLGDYELMLNVDIESGRSTSQYVYDYYYYTDEGCWYFDNSYYGHWQDYWVNLGYATQYSLGDYFILESSGLWNGNYTDCYYIDNSSAAYIYFLLAGADLMFQTQANAEIYASYLTHDRTYFIIPTQEIISNYYLIDISFDYYTEVDEAGLPVDLNTIVYLYDEEALITVSDIGYVNIEDAVNKARTATGVGG